MIKQKVWLLKNHKKIFICYKIVGILSKVSIAKNNYTFLKINGKKFVIVITVFSKYL